MAIGLMEANSSLDTRRREEELAAHAHRMNNAIRMLEDRVMGSTRENTRHTRMPMLLMALQQAHRQEGGQGFGVPMQGAPPGISGEDVPLGMDEGMVRMASAIGQDLALYSLDKEAGIGQVMGNMAKSLKPAAAGLGASLSKGLSSAGTGISNAAQGLKGMVMPKLQPIGKLQGAVQGVSNTAQQAKGALKAPIQAAPKLAPAPPAPAVTANKTAPVPAVQSSNTAATEPTFADKAQKAWAQSGLANGGYKTKLPLLAGGLLAVGGLYAGAKKGFEVLGREKEPDQYNSGGAIPAHGVNQYGVPDRNTPFA